MTGERIKETLSMADVAARYGFEPNRAGFAVCPFHEEHTPSMKVYDEPGRGFHCFGCNKGGSVIDFVMRLFNLNFNDAVHKMSADFGIAEDIKEDVSKLRHNNFLAKQQENKIIKGKILDLCIAHCSLHDTIKRAEPWSDEWCKALHKIDYVDHQIEVLECKTRRKQH